MRWGWRWRKELDTGFYYRLLEDGFIKPEDQEPEITGLHFYIDAFGELNTSRPVGMSVGPIPFTAIAEYFRMYELDEDFDDFLYIIRRLDRVFLELNDKETASKGKQQHGSNSNAKNPNKN